MTMKSKVLRCAVAALAFALPAFGEDAYIESDGTTFINLGHCVGPKTKIELDFQMVEVSNGIRMLGSVGDASNPRCRFYVGTASGGTVCFSFTTSKADGTEKGCNLKEAVADTRRHTLIMDYAASSKQFKIVTDGEAVDSGTEFVSFPENTSQYPIGLFAENRSTYGGLSSTPSGSTFYQPVKMKVYGLKIYENGLEEKNFVPCVKGGCAGLYESHSGLFHQGETYDAISAGGDVMTIKDDPYIWSPRNVLGTGAEKNIFIDTGYTVLPTTRIELDYAMMTNSVEGITWADSYCPYLISAQSKENGGSKNYNVALCVANTTVGSTVITPGCMVYRLGETALRPITYFTITNAFDIRRTVVMDSNTVSFVTAGWTNTTLSAGQYGMPATVDTGVRSLKIGANFAGDGRYLPMKVYGLKIYESNNLVKNYVPFIENGVGGLKNSLDTSDVLLSKTRINYSGTVSDGVKTNVVFDVGGNVACTDGNDEAYLEFDGTNTRGHYVLTDYILMKDSRVDVDFSLWNTRYNGQQRIFDQSTANRSNCILARLYMNSAYNWSLMYGDNHASAPGGIVTVPIDNNRLKFTIDSYNSRLAVTNAGVEVYNQAITTSRTWETGVTNLWIGGSYGGATAAASMRLYSFRIYKKGVLDRNYVPCVRNGVAGLYETCGNKFLQVLGGKVSGATLKGEAFQIAPQPAKLTSSNGRNTATLTCLAAGAQSYEWYEDGVLLPGETSDALTLTWTNEEPHVRTYSVAPVYTVFNETVKGDPVTAEVEYAPMGVTIVIR